MNYPKITLKRGRAKPIWHGHPWVYAQAIKNIPKELPIGSIVDIYDDRNSFLGRAAFNPNSSIAARILSRNADEAIDLRWLKARLDEAITLRRNLNFPNKETDAYRLVNAEGDYLPGLIIDVFGDAIAVQFTAAGYDHLIDDLFNILDEKLNPRIIAEVEPGSFAKIEGIDRSARMIKGQNASTTCKELGISYDVDLFEGQKTGLYLDQRDNHALIRFLAKDKTVVDVYSYVGGFALNAAKGRAKSVTAIDASARAVQAIQTHAEKNQLSGIEAIEADAFAALRGLEAGAADILIIDPPKFARSRRELESALKGYRKLHRRAIRAIAPGGFLLSAICSQLVSQDELNRIIAHAAIEQGRNAKLLEFRGAGMDHPRPPAFNEGHYLKVVLCQIG